MLRMRGALRGPRGEREGSTIVVVVTVVFTLMLSGLVLVQEASTSSGAVTSHLADRRAFYLAEAGEHEAFDVLRAGGTGNLGSMAEPVEYGGGLMGIESTDLGGNLARLVAVALLEDGRASVETVFDVSPAGSPPFEHVLNCG